MATFEWFPRFRADFRKLSGQQQTAFLAAVSQLVADLRVGRFRRGLRVKGVKGSPGVFEMTWAPDGRATFEYGAEVVAGQRHVIWRRIGTHAILREP